MNLFRSEEHVVRWLEQYGYEPGDTLAAALVCELAYAWWSDRLRLDSHTPEQNQAILEEVGLTGPFWNSLDRRLHLEVAAEAREVERLGVHERVERDAVHLRRAEGLTGREPQAEPHRPGVAARQVDRGV